MNERIKLERDVTAVRIPQGDEVELSKGSEVVITQSLGVAYTVVYQDAFLARIMKKDADALGLDEEAEAAGEKTEVEDGDLEGAVWQQLKTVYDPEIPVDIVNLGLVYDCQIQDVEGKVFVNVKMTLTAPGCGMGPTIAADAQGKIMSIEGIHDAKVDLVWDPPWNQEMISEEGKMKLGIL